jgi:hypothetical protein
LGPLRTSLLVTEAAIDSGSLQDRLLPPWDQPGWLDDVTAWIGKHIELTGPVVRHPRNKPWSVVARAPTGRGDLWFKELGPALAFEPALTQELARHFPRYLPEVLAAEGSRLLTLHAGRRVSKLRPDDLSSMTRVWESVAARFAELQTEFVRLGELPAPDFGPETLRRRFGKRVNHLVEELGDAVPLSLVHLGVHRNNVCFRDGNWVFLDRAEAATGHPFCGLGKALRNFVRRLGAQPGGPEVLRVRDAYLEPWTTLAPLHELRAIFKAAYPLGLLCGIVAKERVLDSLPAELYTPELHAHRTKQISVTLTSLAEIRRDPDNLGA